MKFYDVTASIYEGMPVYKNKPEKQPVIQTVTNGYVTESKITMDLHSGTHIDAPLHMVTQGETFETIPLKDLVGEAKVFDLTTLHTPDRISKADVETLDIQEGDFVLFKTQNSFENDFNFDFVFVAADAAAYLADKKIRGLGIDALGVERAQEGHPTHKTLFAAGVIVIEGLRLKEVPEATYTMVAAPLKMVGTDAAPARVLLVDSFSS